MLTGQLLFGFQRGCAGWGQAGLCPGCCGPAWLPCALPVSASLPLATPCPPSASGTPWATGSRAWPSACTGTCARSRTTSPWRRRSSECPPPQQGSWQCHVAQSLPSAWILELSVWALPRGCGFYIPQMLWLGRVLLLPARLGVGGSDGSDPEGISFPMSRSESGSFLIAIKNHICRFDCNLWLTSSMVGWM